MFANKMKSNTLSFRSVSFIFAYIHKHIRHLYTQIEKCGKYLDFRKEEKKKEEAKTQKKKKQK